MHFDSAFGELAHQLPKGLLARMGLEQSAAEKSASAALPRRQFLKMSVASGFALGAYAHVAGAQNAATPAAALKAFEQPAAFVRIDKDGTVTVAVNRLEFGQGVLTALPMILAEELDADWALVRGVHGDADGAYVDPLFGMHLTGGSGSIKHSYTQYRELGARTRAMLLAAAAAHWGVEPAALRTESGKVLGPGGQSLAYGDLAEAAMKMPVPQKVALKDAKDFRIIGKATPRLDGRAKSTGAQGYGVDVRLPGMLTAVVMHPPVFGAKLKSVDDTAAKAVPGVQAVLRMPTDRGGEGVAVLAQGYWAAKQGRDALKLEWDSTAVERVDSVAQLASYQALAKTTGRVKFNADMSPLATAPKKISAEFTFPYLAHAPMEPLNCTVQLSGQGANAKVNLWLGTQMPGFDAMAAAKVLDVPANQVKVNVQMAGGGFGRRGVPTADYVVEACTVAKVARAAGLEAPVRVMWSREDDIKGGYYRPMHVHRAEIGFDAKGRVLGRYVGARAWDQAEAAAWINSRLAARPEREPR